MKKLFNIAISYFDPVIDAFKMLAIFGYLCVVFLEYPAIRISNYLILTWWHWKALFRLLKIKLKRFKTKAFQFLKNLGWSWIFIAYVITFFTNVIFKDWQYIDYIWIAPFVLLLIGLTFNTKK